MFASPFFLSFHSVLGRGNQHTKFPGNRRFYDAIDMHMPMYDVAVSSFTCALMVIVPNEVFP